MSLFEHSQFNWRETYFVLFEQQHRPAAEKIQQALQKLSARYRITDVLQDDDGRFESLTLISPDDYAAMDISFLDGDEVTEQVTQLRKELRGDDEVDRATLEKLACCNARLDVLHFEQLIDLDQSSDDDDIMDPGSLLTVLDRLADLVRGVVFDPQTNCLMG